MIATSLAFGLALSNAFRLPGSWQLAVGCLVCVTILVADRSGSGPAAASLLAIAALVCGLIVGTARIDRIGDGALSGREGSGVELVGFVTAPPRKSANRWRLFIETERGRTVVESPRIPRTVSTGSQVSFSGTLTRPPPWLGEYLRGRGVSTTVVADSVAHLPGRRSGLVGWIDGLRVRAERALGAGIGSGEAALARGFVLGQDQAIEEEVVEDFRASGLAHLLAVSGQNILLLSILATPLLAALGLPLGVRLAVIVGLIALYVPVTGAGPSIQRAGIMGVAAIAATAAARPVMRSWILALAAALTLAMNPVSLFDPGWQLSFAAVAGIMLFARPVTGAISGVLPGRGSRVASVLAEGVAVTAAASITTLPLVAFHFETLPLTTLGANLVAMPAVAPSMWLGMSAAALGQVNELLALPLNQVNAVLLAFIARVADLAGGEGATLQIPRPGPLWLLAGTGVAIASIRVLIRFPRVLVVVLAGAVLIPGLLLLGSGRRDLGAPPPDGIRIEMLDVGQGDAFLIRSHSGRSLLVDTGPPGGGVGEAVASAGVDRLDGVLLTHLDLDHIGGLDDVLGRFEVGTVFFEQLDGRVRSAIEGEGAAGRRLSAGDILDLDPGRLTVLSPSPDIPASTDRNARSLVLMVEALGHRTLLTGDAESEAVQLRPGPLDVLKLAHHGSRDEGLEEFLAATAPLIGLISAGRDNRYGHPDPSTMTALGAAGVRAYRTDRDGTVSVVISPGGIAIESGR